MLLHCNNYAFAKTPSYPPVRGRLDTFSACVSSSREVSVSGLPLTGG